MEEVFQLLRAAPRAALACYFTGTLPFALGALFFWSDMARSAGAEDRLVGASLTLALLFAWMKCWQALYARWLGAFLCGTSPAPLGVAALCRLAAVQLLLQASGLLVLPIALVVLAPFAWVFAFYNNVTALGADEPRGAWALCRRAWHQATLWPAENHVLLLVLKLFGLVLLLNWISAVVALPYLLKSLLGVESVFTRSAWALLNSTVGAVVVTLTWLCLDPLIKAAYVLRCFYGESLGTGQDLRAELKRLEPALESPRASVPSRAWVRGVALGFCLASLAAAAEPPGPPQPSRAPAAGRALDAPALDRTISEVIQRREYAWRLPRDRMKPETDDAVGGLLARVGQTLKNWFRQVGRWIKDAFNALRKWFNPPAPAGMPGGNWASAMRQLLFVLVVILALVLGWLLWRLWRERRAAPPVAAEPLPPAPDLTDENVRADQLPGEEWLRLAQEHAARGDHRLALRALFLASLAALAERNLIALARFKSNRDYERELLRRAHALGPLPALFADNVSAFERVWYGRHEATPDLLGVFIGNVERIRNGGAA